MWVPYILIAISGKMKTGKKFNWKIIENNYNLSVIKSKSHILLMMKQTQMIKFTQLVIEPGNLYMANNRIFLNILNASFYF